MSKRIRTGAIALAFVSVSPASLQAAQRTAGSAESVRGVESWRAEREAALRADDGWLTLKGRHWPWEGTNRGGGGPTAEITLLQHSQELGTIGFAAGTARFTPAPGAEVRINGRPARAQGLRPQPGDYDTVSAGGISFFVIKRGERYGARVRDRNSASRRSFAGLPRRTRCQSG